jgi:hypothetical protein
VIGRIAIPVHLLNFFPSVLSYIIYQTSKTLTLMPRPDFSEAWGFTFPFNLGILSGERIPDFRV